MNKYMEAAFNEARIGMHSGKGRPFRAVVVKNSKMSSAASNEVSPSCDPTAQAEITTIRKACQKLHRYDLNRMHALLKRRAMLVCLSAIIWANIKTVYYACSADKAAKIRFRDSMIYRYLHGK